MRLIAPSKPSPAAPAFIKTKSKPLFLLGLLLLTPATHAQYTYGTNASGGSCIANGVDCYTGYQGGGGGGAPTRYAAFAVISDEGTAYGLSYNQGSRAAAEADAVRRCSEQANGKACEVVGWFYNTCGALALDEGKRWGFAHSSSRRTAEKQALKNCENVKDAAGACKISKSFCQ